MRKLYEIEEDIANLIELDADRYVDGMTGEISAVKRLMRCRWNGVKKLRACALGTRTKRPKLMQLKLKLIS